MKLRPVARIAGRVLIALGVLTQLFVVYQLWGTGFQEARAQDRLRDEFEGLLAEERGTTTTSTRPRAGQPGTTEVPPPAPMPEGEAVAIVEIPKIGLEKVVVEGVSVSDLKKAPGHYPGTPMPGRAGNAAIAGHRTTYGAPFGDLDGLEKGDAILVTTREGRFRYEVTERVVVPPTAVEVLDQTADSRLTLTTCHPRFSARQRLVVVAALQGESVPSPPTTTTTTVRPPPVAGDGEVEADRPEAQGFGLSGEGASNVPTIAWGTLAGLIWLGTWALGRRWRRWPAYALGTPVFLVALAVFYENVARLLPANV